MEFEWHLEESIFDLHRDLAHKRYRHGLYTGFYITDPKRRHIHKAIVRDRVLHHAIYSKLYTLFDPTFIATSFSCRIGKGTHRGVMWLRDATRAVSQNYTKPCFVLKCDIKKFFDSVDHTILLDILRRRIKDKDVMLLLCEVVGSYGSERSNLFLRKGVPIGNLTSQLFANIYMNEFDQFMKHQLRVKYYARYTDDFVIVFHDTQTLTSLLSLMTRFLKNTLQLSLHPNKVTLHKVHNGIDYLGYVVLPHFIVTRTKTRKRMYRGVAKRVKEYRRGDTDEVTPKQSLQSYLGTLSHADAYEVGEDLKNHFWFLMSN